MQEGSVDGVRVVGNRLALVGAILYFAEWIAIAILPSVPTDRLSDDPAAITAAYDGHAGVVAFAAGWFSFVLLGRILFASAVRQAFRASGVRSALLDFAVAAMAVSVALEIASFALTAAAGWTADAGSDATVVAALDSAGSIGFLMIYAPLGASVAAFSVVMLASRLLAGWIGWLGLAAGFLGVLGGVIAAAATGADGTFHDVGSIPTAIGALAFWIWLLVVGTVLWRQAPGRRGRGADRVSAAT